MIDVTQYNKLETLTDFAKRKGKDPSNIRQYLARKNDKNSVYFTKKETPIKVAKTWLVLSK